MTQETTLAVVGATGGAGATRLTVEFGATLARAGRDVAVIDAAWATQGLATHVPGRLDVDVTALVTDDRDADLSAGLVEYPVDLPGELVVCPARAPFERLARAKAPAAAQRFESRIETARDRFDAVLVDTPPVAANQAVAAVTAADGVALVCPATERGLDRLPAMRDRLYDLGAQASVAIANRADGDEPVSGADAQVPTSDRRDLADLPACADPDPTFAPAVAEAVETATGTALDLSFPEAGLLG